MVTGVDKTRTGSYDTYFDNQTSVQDNKGYAYLGIRNLPTPRPEFTWPSASKNDFNLRDLQMYTPYPSGTERGKLYFVDVVEYANDGTVPGKGEGWYSLEMPDQSDAYYVVTPTLNEAGYVNSESIAIYAFADIDDLWDNGWRISNSQTANQSIPVTTSASWTATKNYGGGGSAWGGGFSPYDGNPTVALRSKEQIVQAMFACTNVASQIQTALGISFPNQLHGAVVIAGSGSVYDNDTWKGVIPITGSLVVTP